MKKILALILTVCLAFSVAGVYASAETLDGIEDIATYTVPDATQYGQPWYVDEVGEYKLFDGEIPDANMLDAARDEAIKEKFGNQRLVCLAWLDCTGQDGGRCL